MCIDELFFDNDMPTIRSSSSSSEGLPRLLGLSREASLESNEVTTAANPTHIHIPIPLQHVNDYTQTLFFFPSKDSDQAKRSCPRRPNKPHHSKAKNRHSNSDSAGNYGTAAQSGPLPSYTGPKVDIIMCDFVKYSTL